MGYFGYEFVNLSKEQVATRRIALDTHAQIAQVSQLLVLVGLLALRIGSRLTRRWAVGDSESAPSSPQKKYLAEGRQKSFFSNFTAKWRILKWKLDDEVAGSGTWGQWIGGALWTIWLGVLCAQGTGPGTLLNNMCCTILLFLIQHRLHAPYEAIWTCGCIAAAIPFSSGFEKSIFTSTAIA